MGGIERGHEGGVDSKLRSAPEWESICDDLDAAVIEALEVDVAGARKVGSARLVLERPGRSLLTECQK